MDAIVGKKRKEQKKLMSWIIQSYGWIVQLLWTRFLDWLPLPHYEGNKNEIRRYVLNVFKLW